MSLISVRDLNFIESTSLNNSKLSGGNELGNIMFFLPDIALPFLSLDDGSNSNNGTVDKQSQAIASYSGDKGGSTQTFTYSN